jgi:hypothetical protein
MNDTNIQDLLRRIERLLRTWPHMRPWVEQMVKNAESQKWQGTQ